MRVMCVIFWWCIIHLFVCVCLCMHVMMFVRLTDSTDISIRHMTSMSISHTHPTQSTSVHCIAVGSTYVCVRGRRVSVHACVCVCVDVCVICTHMLVCVFVCVLHAKLPNILLTPICCLICCCLPWHVPLFYLNLTNTKPRERGREGGQERGWLAKK